MDSIIRYVYGRLVQVHHCSVDRILENPNFRVEFLNEARKLLGELPEEQILHRLVTLRKARQLPPSREITDGSVA